MNFSSVLCVWHFCCSFAKSCLTVCNPMECSTPGSSVLTISWSLLKLTSIELMITFNYLILSWAIKKAERQRIDAFELWCWRRLERPLDCKEIKPDLPKGNQSWIFIERTDAEAPILWLPDAKSWLIGKDSDAGKDWGLEEKGATEDLFL